MEKTMKIMINDFANDGAAISYDKGQECLKKILKTIEVENVILDFSDVNYVITAFLNPVIGDLILNKGEKIMNKITITNANDSVIEKIKIVKEGALLKREDLEI